MRSVLYRVVTEEGIFAIYKGIFPAWLRCGVYSSLGMGLYKPMRRIILPNNKNSFLQKFIAGAVSGAIGSACGCPFDILKIRMMAYEGSVNKRFFSFV